MNNQEFRKLLKEWKQKKELEENLEEGVLDKLKAGVLGATMATGLASASPAIAAPAKNQVVTQQTSELSKIDLAALGYLELYTRNKKADTDMDIYKAMESLKNQKETKDPRVTQIINVAKQNALKAEKEKPERFETYVKYGEGVAKINTFNVDSTKNKNE